MRIAMLTIFVTSQCGENCPYCSQTHLRQSLGKYHMGLDEVGKLIERCQILGVHYDLIRLSGGEPTLWKHIYPGLEMLSNSGIADKFDIASNCQRPDVIEAIIDLLSAVRLTLYPNNSDSIREIALKYPEKVNVWGEAHRKMPAMPLKGTLPANCCCTAQAYSKGWFYSCPNAFSNACHVGLDVHSPELACSVNENFGAHFLAHHESRYSHLICSVCLANEHVWKIQRPTELPSTVSPGDNISIASRAGIVV